LKNKVKVSRMYWITCVFSAFFSIAGFIGESQYAWFFGIVFWVIACFTLVSDYIKSRSGRKNRKMEQNPLRPFEEWWGK
jgi:hypothetical protein